MICPNCQAPCGENDRFCSCCGTPLQNTPKKGTHLVPSMILIVLSILGIVVFALSIGKTMNFAPQGSDTPWFRVNHGTLYFLEDAYTGTSELTVPSQVDGVTVTRLAENCFKNCTSLTTVILPDTLQEIGPGAFSGCTSLRGIFIPGSVTAIGRDAFSGCRKLEAICVPASVTAIGESAFGSCPKLHHIFFLGSYDSWCRLYSEFITPHTGVYCTDGAFRQGGEPTAP